MSVVPTEAVNQRRMKALESCRASEETIVQFPDLETLQRLVKAYWRAEEAYEQANSDLHMFRRVKDDVDILSLGDEMRAARIPVTLSKWSFRLGDVVQDNDGVASVKLIESTELVELLLDPQSLTIDVRRDEWTFVGTTHHSVTDCMSRSTWTNSYKIVSKEGKLELHSG